MLKHSQRYSRKKCSKKHISRLSNKKKSGRRSLGKIKRRSLRKNIYSIHNKQKNRKRSLKKAVKVYGKNIVIKKINAVRVLNKNTNPKISEIYKKDLEYVKSL